MSVNHEWNGIRLEIAEYCRKYKIGKDDFRFLNLYEWQTIYDKVLKHFVDDQYAKRYGLHWSNVENGFKREIKRVYGFRKGVDDYLSHEWIENLPKIVNCEKVYLLLEETSGKHWIAECRPAVVHLIINEATVWGDYYITDKKFNWLITENHHEFVQFLGEGLNADRIQSLCKHRVEK